MYQYNILQYLLTFPLRFLFPCFARLHSTKVI